jgi:hypothetical protein
MTLCRQLAGACDDQTIHHYHTDVGRCAPPERLMGYPWYAGIALAVLIVGLLAYASTKPNQFRIERSITIHSPPKPLFAILSDFHESESWSP